MNTAVDTNVFVSLLTGPMEEARAARHSLRKAEERGPLVVCAPVYAELSAAPGRGPDEVDVFLDLARVAVDWDLSEDTWRTAALAFKGYAERQRAQPGGSGPRRILADFVIGAHALHTASALLTLDHGLYRVAFPDLAVLVPE